MVYECKRCNCVFEVNIIDSKEEVEYVVCAKCGIGAYHLRDIEPIIIEEREEN